MKELKDLPNSNDNEFWGDSEKIRVIPKPVLVCKTHNKTEYMEGEYIDNGDGTVSCTKCGWGFMKPGYLRVVNGRLKFLMGVDR